MISNRLNDKRAIITGASSGIGRAVALELAAHGCHLELAARRQDRLESLKQNINGHQGEVDVQTHKLDVSNPKACVEFAEQMEDKTVDILINNAGLAVESDPVHQGKFDDFDQMIDTNIKGLLYLSRMILPEFRKRNAGHVVNIGSTAGHEAYAGGAVYCATKYAVRAITDAMKKELHGTQVRVSMVSPGLVKTEFSEVRFKGDVERAESVYRDMQPLTSEDVAEIIAFVVSRPEHVNIFDTVVYPVDQSGATMVYRHES